ncbi:MAG: hypothetical protein ACLGIE_17815, partial [Alphaproteobacteria bacterium]
MVRDPKTDLLTINNEMVISLVLARCQPMGDGRLRWRIRFDPMRYQADVTLAVRLDPQNQGELDYYLLPWLDLPRQEIRLCNRTSIAFDGHSPAGGPRSDHTRLRRAVAKRTS